MCGLLRLAPVTWCQASEVHRVAVWISRVFFFTVEEHSIERLYLSLFIPSPLRDI